MEACSNPLLIKHGLPAYDRIEPAHLEPAVTQILARGREILPRSKTPRK